MGAPQVTDTNWLSSVLAVTMDQYKESVTDNVYNNNAALLLLKDKSMVDARVSGYQIQVPLMLGKNTSVKSFTGYDAFDNSPQKGIVDAYTGFSNYGALITISDDELDMNADKEQVVSILQTKIMQAEGSILDEINDNIYTEGTTVGNGGKDILSLGAMCELSATPGEYMGVTNSTYWVNQYETGTSGVVLADLTDLYFKCTDGRDIPDIILANTKYVTAYETANRTSGGATISYVNAKLADAGFAALEFKGIPMVLDKSLDDNDSGATGKAFMLNSKYLGLPYKEVKTSSFTESDNQFAKVAKMRFRLQLLTDKRRRQGVHVFS